MAKIKKKYRRFPKLEASEVSGEFFIVDDLNRSIQSLGQTGSALWRLLDEPKSRGECIAVFAAAFPDEPAENIKKIVRDGLKSLVKKGVIYSHR